MSTLAPLITAFLALAAVAYIALGVSISGSGPRPTNAMVGIFLFLIAGMLAGSAFSYGTENLVFYGVGRTLSFMSAGFVPVVFYLIYRQYTVGPPRTTTIALLCLVPLITTGLAVTNSFHGWIWQAIQTPMGMSYSLNSEHGWYNNVFAPFTYGLFGYAAIALLARLSTIAPAHRKTIMLLLFCALTPFSVSVANNFFGFGPPDFPVTSLSLALIWPVLAYASLALRVHEFSPIAYQTLFNHVRDPIFVVDNEQRIICANQAAQALLKGAERDLIGRKLWEDFPAARAILRQARELDLTQTLKIDSSSTYEVSVGPLHGANGYNQGMVVVCRDVSERRAAQDKLADSERLVRTLIETSSNGILRFANQGNHKRQDFRCIFANQAAEEFLDRDLGSLIGASLNSLKILDPQKLLGHFGGKKQAKSQMTFEVAVTAQSAEHWLRIVAEPVGDDFSITLIDVTQSKKSEDKMLEEAVRDPLTGVLNRRGFEQEGSARIDASKTGAVLYLDLNQFKAINDLHGHPTGDALLRAFGHRLDFCLRPEDVLGRLGGDEFAIVLPGVSVDDVKQVASRVIRTASEPYILQGKELRCAASVGIALQPEHGEELWTLVGVADRAMYDVKNLPNQVAANDSDDYVSAAIASREQ